MGLRINQNLSAHTALNYVRNNDTGLNKAIERLSSGLRIVRGADDPAGLIISEKYRAQIEGLGQAMANSKDGINMVQTAEGALDEVSSILRNTRNLALHAANTGPNDTEALAADQKQIKAALTTLDRIASTTQFGSKKVLDGSAGSNGTVTNANVSFVGATEATQSGTYAVNVTSVATQGKAISNTAGTAAGRTTGQVTAATAGTGTMTAVETLTLTVAGNNTSLTLAATDTLDTTISKINADSTAKAAGFTASKNASGQLVVTSDRLSSATEVQMTVTNLGGATDGGEAVLGIGAAGAGNTQTTSAASTSSKLSNDELLTFSNGTNTVNVGLTAGSTIASSVSSINTAMKNAGIKMTASFNTTSKSFELQNDEYGSKTTVTNTFSSNNVGTDSTGLGSVADTTYNLAESGAALGGGVTGADVAGSIGTLAATGKGQFMTGMVGTAVEGLDLKVSGTTTGSLGDVKIDNNSLKFQIGAFSAETVALSIDSVSTTRMGTNATGVQNAATQSLADIDVSTGSATAASDAIKVIDAAISQVSNLRSKIGSFQKDVLESTVRNLSTAQQNIRASESNIRDADFAEEMLTFSRGQILSQTGFSMLTQANQSAQQVLKLFG